MRQDEAERIEEGLSYEPDVVDDGDNPLGTWVCESCSAGNSELDGECQFCDGPVCALCGEPCTACNEGGTDAVTCQCACQ